MGVAFLECFMLSVADDARASRKRQVAKKLPEWVKDPTIWEEDRKKGDRAQVRFRCHCSRSKVLSIVRVPDGVNSAAEVGELLSAQCVADHGACQTLSTKQDEAEDAQLLAKKDAAQ